MQKVDLLLWIGFIIIQWGIIMAQETPQRRRTKRTTQSFKDYVKSIKKNALFYEYNPNYGYEPYWADGEWLMYTSTLITRADGMTETTTKAPPKACGQDCNHLFQRIKHVCARQSGTVKLAKGSCGTGVMAAVLGGFHGDWDKYLMCDGYPGPDYMPGFKTFDTYCEFLAAQCRHKFYAGGRLVLVHVGKCQYLSNPFKPLWTDWYPVQRYKSYLSSVGKMIFTTTITVTGKGMQTFRN